MLKASFVLPVGIGDVSWVYSKICCLKEYAELDMTLYAADMEPRRVGGFVELLPDVTWGGYVDVNPAAVLLQCLPSEWPALWLWEVFWKLPMMNISANGHLEMGRPLADFLPILPTDYHYPMKLEPFRAAAEAMMPEPRVTALVTSRAAQKDWKWRLWTADEWADFLAEALAIAGRKDIMLLGANYDEEETRAVGGKLQAWGFCVDYVIGEELGLALAFVERSAYFFGINSGISILANVLRTPAFSILPVHLKGLEESYADPHDTRTGRYKCMTKPSVERAVQWFETVGKVWVR